MAGQMEKQPSLCNAAGPIEKERSRVDGPALLFYPLNQPENAWASRLIESEDYLKILGRMIRNFGPATANSVRWSRVSVNSFLSISWVQPLHGKSGDHMPSL